MFQVKSAIVTDAAGAGIVPVYLSITPQNGQAITARTSDDDGGGGMNFGDPGFQSDEGTVLVFDPTLAHQGATAFLSDLAKAPRHGITYDVATAALKVVLPNAAGQ